MPFEHECGDSVAKVKTDREAIGKKARFEVFKRDSFTCQYCGAKAPDVILHVDHIDPVANGGGKDMLNLITSCEGCNLGKGARTLSDDSEIVKQREQLAELNARREQLEAMLQWREGLRDMDKQELSSVCQVWDDHIYPCSISESGIADFKKLARKFGYAVLLQAIDKAADSYLKHNDEGVTLESANLAFSKLGGCCYYIANPEPDNQDRDIFYIRGILKNRLGYVNAPMCIKLLRDAVAAGANLDAAKEIAKEVKSWTEFREIIEGFIDRQQYG